MNILLASLSLAARTVAHTSTSDTASPGRAARSLLAAAALSVAGLSLNTSVAVTQPSDPAGEEWAGTWGASPAGAPLPAQMLTFSDQTLRLIVHTSIGGSRVRIRLSNESGTAPLHIGAVHIARRQSGAIITTGSDRPLTFGGAAEVTIVPGEPVLSDPVEFDVPAESDLAVSMYLPGQAQASTAHVTAFQTNYVSLPGNFAGAEALPTDHMITSWPFLAEVDVAAPNSPAAAGRESPVNGGADSTAGTGRWPDLLAARLRTARDLLYVNNK